LDVLLLAVIVAGVGARIAALPGWIPDSGDEWGNAVAPLRALQQSGNPGLFVHPSLYYDLTAAAYAAMFAGVHALGLAPAAQSMSDLLVLDERWFTWTARAVSVAAAALTMWALYAFGRTLWDRTAGLLAAALLAVLPLHAVYSEAVRVDSLFVLAFVVAFWRIAVLLERPDRAGADTAAVCTGLAVAANYNGGLLIVWLIAALRLRPAGDGRRAVPRALLLVGAAFLVACPYVLLDAPTFLQHLGFISSLSLTEHPGMEGLGVLFYARQLFDAHPLLAATVAVACLAMALRGTRRERFVLSLPVVYFVLFSLMRTKFDRFILPAAVLLLLVAAGLPSLLARRWPPARIAALALLLACIATLAPRTIPLPRHQALARADGVVLDWLEHHAAPGSRIHVQSGVLPLIDILEQGGPFAAALRESLVRVRPGLDHQYFSAVYVGGRAHYEPDVLTAKRIDYAIANGRTMHYIDTRCAELPDVCAVQRDMQARGVTAFVTPDGVEPTIIYQLAGNQNQHSR
jgi:hypothetical protein